MATEIKDGSGSGLKAKVDGDHRLCVASVNKTELQHAIDKGETWNLGTDYVTLTSDNPSDLIYIENTSGDAYAIDLYIVNTKASTGGSGDVDIEILRNPTGGTTISAGSDILGVNMNFSSNNKIEGILKAGVEGSTLTGEDDSLRSKTTADNRLLLGTITRLERGASVGVRVTPPAGNTSMEVEVIVEIFKED